MRLTSEHIETARSVLLGLTGLACLIYAALALWQGRPDPIYWWFPGALGLMSALILAVMAFMAGRAASGQARDEHYRDRRRRAASGAYWFSLALFVPFAVLGRADWPTAVASYGTLMGASFLLLFVWQDWRAGR